MRPARVNGVAEPRVLNGVSECASWRHSWHFSPYLSEVAVPALCGHTLSWESQLGAGAGAAAAEKRAAAAVKPRRNTNGLFPWRRQGTTGSPCSSPSPSPGLRPATPEGARTAPATPLKEHNGSESNQYRRSPGLSKSVRHTKTSSTPVDETATSRSDWDIRRSLPQDKTIGMGGKHGTVGL